jgi:hypothetical protein
MYLDVLSVNIEERSHMFKPGPLYDKRKEITEKLKSLPLQTGDIVYNAANVTGPFGIPFSKMIQYFTNSLYSHGTVILVEGNETYAIDVSDWGTRKLRIVDWFDNWYMTDFCIYRLKNKTKDDEICLDNNVKEFLEIDPSYDFNFNDPKAYYCTESVKEIYMKCGHDLGGSYLLKDIVPSWFYYMILIGNFFTSKFTGSSLPTKIPINIVGNVKKGMMASNLTERIFEYHL